MTETSFPRQYARTQRFSLGMPRDFAVSPDGGRVLFLRSGSGSDAVTCLWQFDVASGEESLLLDPRTLLDGGSEDLPPEELARRERARESSQGVVRFATDAAQRAVVFTLSGRLFLLDLPSAAARELKVAGPVLDPRPDPTGRFVAYVSGGSLRVVGTDGSDDRAVAEPEAGTVTYGLAEFVAAEEMDRFDGYWWSPEGTTLLVARVDTAPVTRVWTPDPAHPDREPAEHRFPFAGTPNAEVTLSLVAVDGSARAADGPVEVSWDRASHEYLARVAWSEHGLRIAVQSRDQRSVQLLDVDAETGRCSLAWEDRDDHWVPLVDGVPAVTASGSLVWTVDGTSRALIVGPEVVTPEGLQVRSVLDVDGESVLFTASTEPTEVDLWLWSPEEGARRVAGGARVHSGRRQGGTTVVVERRLDRPGATVTVVAPDGTTHALTSHEEIPVVTPRLQLLRAGDQELRTGLLLPTGYEPGRASLPVLLDPYGGPGAQRVVASHAAYLVSQWFADQGFAVVVADGRGTPGRGPAWERAIAADLAGPVLEDQVTALHAAAETCGDLDLERVAIRGWSFGGFLAALAVLRRPDVFHVAVAGAPVTDWKLYDTHYTERYLGTPAANPDAYARSGLLDAASSLSRPLMIVHGLSDDNVLVADTLQLSGRLTAAGRPHTVLPLSGVTHMTPQEEVAENLLLLQLDFLKTALRM